MAKNFFIILLVLLTINFIEANDEIVIIKSNDNIFFNRIIEGFNKSISMKREFNNISISTYNLKGDDNLTEEVISKIENKPNVMLIITLGARASEVTSKSINNIPVIFAGVINYNRYNLDFDNVYGIKNEIDIKIMLSLLRMLNSNIKRIGVFSRDFQKEYFEREKKELKNMGIELVIYDLPSSTGRLRRTLRRIFQDCDAFYFTSDISLLREYEYILSQSERNNIPIITFSSELVKTGLLASVSVDYYTIGVQISNLMTRIMDNSLKGNNIHQPVGTFSSLNTNTLSKLNINPPDYVIRMIEEVFE